MTPFDNPAKRYDVTGPESEVATVHEVEPTTRYSNLYDEGAKAVLAAQARSTNPLPTTVENRTPPGLAPPTTMAAVADSPLPAAVTADTRICRVDPASFPSRTNDVSVLPVFGVTTNHVLERNRSTR
ncbi:unannotated protein [freshwater metagenome]|uniref:Unannotated protein n=1 Tax=freshwater metagenome TaxID=449393 RepID=A0A6J6ECM0_9ZZZZ